MELYREATEIVMLEQAQAAVERNGLFGLSELAARQEQRAVVANFLADVATDFVYADPEEYAAMLTALQEEAEVADQQYQLSEFFVEEAVGDEELADSIKEESESLSRRVLPGNYPIGKEASNEEYRRVALNSYASSVGEHVKKVYRQERTAAIDEDDFANSNNRANDAAEKLIADFTVQAEASEVLLGAAKEILEEARTVHDAQTHHKARFFEHELGEELAFDEVAVASAEDTYHEDILLWHEF